MTTLLWLFVKLPKSIGKRSLLKINGLLKRFWPILKCYLWFREGGKQAPVAYLCIYPMNKIKVDCICSIICKTSKLYII